jgi:hypothetical protein
MIAKIYHLLWAGFVFLGTCSIASLLGWLNFLPPKYLAYAGATLYAIQQFYSAWLRTHNPDGTPATTAYRKPTD